MHADTGVAAISAGGLEIGRRRPHPGDADEQESVCFFASLLDCDDFGGDLALTRVVKPEVHAEGQKTS